MVNSFLIGGLLEEQLKIETTRTLFVQMLKDAPRTLALAWKKNICTVDRIYSPQHQSVCDISDTDRVLPRQLLSPAFVKQLKLPDSKKQMSD